MNLPTLYKVDSKGKIREWSVRVEDNPPTIIVAHGAKDGKMQEKSTVISKGKNIGRANETTPQEQAKAEAESKWNKQKDKGYGETIRSNYFLPMLAHRFDKYPNKVKYPCYIQPKLDGLRANILYEDGWKMFSRRGKEFKVFNHIVESLSLPKNIVLDGELYSHKLTFQEIVSASKRDEPNELTKEVKLHVYDLHDTTKSITFKERYDLLKKYISDETILVDTYLCNDEDEVTEYHQSFVKDGFEGSIIRNITGKYKVDGRSYDLLKVKDFDDAEFLILNSKDDKNGEAVFVCEAENGIFDVKPKGTHEERVEYLNPKYIGKMLTVQYFGLTDDGIPRFPVGLRIFQEI